MKDYLGRQKQGPSPQTGTPSTDTWQRDMSGVAAPAPASHEGAVQCVTEALQRAEASQQPLQAKTGIPDEVRGSMEGAMGADFSGVRVHTNSVQAKSIGAVAYTRGNDIHFAPGHYNPGSHSGRQLLGHELAHVVQQRQGRVKATGKVGGMPLNDSPKLEAEADRMGARAASFKGGA